MNSKIYEAILNRCSVRRYEAHPLSPEKIAQIENEISQITPLHPENKINFMLKNTRKGEDLATLVGGYGKILSPPHYLVTSMNGNAFALTDLGYCVERLVLRLTSLGIGTCYVGTIGQEEKVRAHFQLAATARIGALVAFGTPAGGMGRVVNHLIRKSVGATNKLPAEKIFFTDSFDQPTRPPAELAPLIEAARLAPSAVNAQPWRLLQKNNQLFLFVASRYPKGKADYRLFDGGICLANLSVAQEALGWTGNWHFLTNADPSLPDYPDNLQPLARLQL
jgi:nitroreductase